MNNLVSISLYGEGSEKSEEEMVKLRTELNEKFHKLLEDRNYQPAQVYNADQTGLFYNTIPNIISDETSMMSNAVEDDDREPNIQDIEEAEKVVLTNKL